MTLDRDDVGHRVVVRRVIDRRHGGRPLMTDALGTLTSLTDTELTVETDAGPLTIAREQVVAAKRVPPRPPPRRSRHNLQEPPPRRSRHNLEEPPATGPDRDLREPPATGP